MFSARRYQYFQVRAARLDLGVSDRLSRAREINRLLSVRTIPGAPSYLVITEPFHQGLKDEGKVRLHMVPRCDHQRVHCLEGQQGLQRFSGDGGTGATLP